MFVKYMLMQWEYYFRIILNDRKPGFEHIEWLDLGFSAGIEFTGRSNRS